MSLFRNSPIDWVIALYKPSISWDLWRLILIANLPKGNWLRACQTTCGGVPRGIGLWGLWSNEGFNDGFSIWLEVTELWKVQLDWRMWTTREPHGSYSLLWPRPIVALLRAAGQGVSYSTELSLLWWIAMSETMNSRNNSPIYLVSVRHSVKVTMKLTANFSKICSLRILSFSIQSFVRLQGLWSWVNRPGGASLEDGVHDHTVWFLWKVSPGDQPTDPGAGVISLLALSIVLNWQSASEGKLADV